jgi:hypothetical protein
MHFEDFSSPEEEERPSADHAQERAEADLERFFDGRREAVFFSRQLEVFHERTYFHWITNRALRMLEDRGVILSERRSLVTGGEIKILWHRSFRYYRRAASRLISLVNQYSAPNMGAALGLQGEALVLEGFAREQFLLQGRNTRTFMGRTATSSHHDLDFIFSRDGFDYGVEVKNTLGYMKHDELAAKIQLCAELNVSPVFAARMLPKVWIHEVVRAGGFGLVLGFQLYPWAHKELAQRVRQELELPVDAPRALEGGTVGRFVRWHAQRVNSRRDSPAP